MVMDIVFKALADPVRRIIIDELAERDSQTLFELCNRLISRHNIAISRQGVSKHLQLLESAKLVRSEQQGRYRILRFNPEPLDEIYTRWVGKFK